MSEIELEVYRVEVEKSEGKTYGIFTAHCHIGGEEIWTACQEYKQKSGCYSMPEPREDGIDICLTGSDYVCGVETPEKLLEWVPKYYLNLFLSAGFRISKYKVKTTIDAIGQHQVVWHRNNQKLVSSLTIEDLMQEVKGSY